MCTLTSSANRLVNIIIACFFYSPEYAAGPKGYDSAKSKERFEKFKNANRRNPVPEEARRWLRQARADLKSAYNDYDVEEPAYEWVLLKAHQVSQ